MQYRKEKSDMGTTIESDWENTRLLEELEAARAEIDKWKAKAIDLEVKRDIAVSTLEKVKADRTVAQNALAEQCKHTKTIEQQLAAEQAKNVGLRELVEHFALIDLGRNLLPGDFGLWVLRARKAIATPSDTAEVEQLKAYNETRTAEVLAATQRLAAEQAKNVGLREALHYSLGAWEYDGISDEHGSIFQEACSRCDAPSDTSALEAIVKKAGEVMREKCADASIDLYSERSTFEAIHALPAVTLDDLKGGA